MIDARYRNAYTFNVTPDPIAIDEGVPDPSNRQSSGWDIRNAPRNYVSLVAFQFGSAVFSFASVWIITRYLGSEGYGGIVAIIAASQVAQVFITWTSVAVVRFGVDEFVETEKISRTFWTVLIALGANLILVAALSALWFPVLANWLKLTPASFWLVIAHLTITVIWVQVQMSLQAAKLPRVQGFLQMIERLLIFAGIFVLTAAANLKPVWAMLCYIIAPAAMIFVGIFRLRSYIFARFSVDRVFVRKILAFSVPLLPFSLVGYFSGSYVDAVFISNFLSTRDLGIYSVATQINGMALQIPTLANTLLLPLFVTLQRETEGARTFDYFRNVLPSLTMLWGLACTAVAFVAYFVIPVVFGAEFQAAALPLWILLTASTIAIPVAIGYAALSNATSTTYISMIAAILAAVTNIIANFILIPKYGSAGCALATLLAFFVSVTTFAVLMRRAAKMPISWTYFAILPAIAGALLMAAYQTPLWGLAACVAMSILVGYWFRDSLGNTLLFLRNLRM